jgi:type II secretory pathway component PulF
MAPKRDWVPVLAWAVAAFLTSIALYLLMFVLPKFVALFQEMGVQEFPLPTLVAMKLYLFLASKWWLVALALIALAAFSRTTAARRWWERLLSDRSRRCAPLIAACLGVVAVPVVALASFLPLVTVTGQLAAP